MDKKCPGRATLYRYGFGFWLLAFTLVFTGCETTKSLSSRNVDFIYRTSDLILHPEYRIHHYSDSSSHLYVKIAKSELLFISNGDKGQTANISFRYRIFNTMEQYHPNDSGSVILRDLKDADGKPYFHGKIDIPLSMGSSGVIEMRMIDLNRNRNSTHFIRFRKTDYEDAGAFLPLTASEEVVFEDYIVEPGQYLIKHPLPLTKLYVQYYYRNFDIASPPFAIVNPKPFDFTPDSSYAITAISPGVFSIPVARKGFYLLSVGEGARQGFTLFFFDPYFPKTKSVMALLEPIRYITTDSEYDNFLKESDNLKLKVDEFWLRIGGNPDRARELIRAYYGRVERANELFTSYLEGWKTDRGLCYIIFGPPDMVYLRTNAEYWVYGEAGSYASLNFTFTKVTNPFTDNDYRLNRSGTFKNPWYRSVDVWRNGRIINLNQ